jgi:hypothetical protein
MVAALLPPPISLISQIVTRAVFPPHPYLQSRQRVESSHPCSYSKRKLEKSTELLINGCPTAS